MAWVRDGSRTERIPRALVSSALPRSLISSRLAGRIVRSVGESWRCTSSPSVGKACGPVANDRRQHRRMPSGDSASD